MITNRTAKMAVKLTSHLFAKHPNLSLEAIDGSPVSMLVGATNLPVRNGVSLEELVDDVREVSAEANLGDGSEHDLVLEDSTESAVAAINASSNFARNVLRPATDKVDNQVRDALANATPYRYHVEPYFIHDIFFTGYLKEAVEKYNNSPMESLPRLALPDMPEGDLTALLNTGMGGWDDAVSGWLATKPEGWLHEVYSRCFGVVCDSDLIADYQNPLKTDAQGNLRIEFGIQREDFLLAAFLLASGLYHSPLNTDKTGSEWRNALATWQQQLGLSLDASIESMAYYIKDGRLVLHWPIRGTVWLKDAASGKITVLGNAYNQWLQQGGSPEIIVGALFADSERLPTHAQDFTQNAERYAQEYQRYEQVLSREVANRAHDIIRQAFITSIMMALGEATSDELPPGIALDDLRDAVMDKIEGVAQWESVDIYRTAREILALEVFRKPTALWLLERIDELMEADADLEPAEAAYKAIEAYVAEYVSNQVKVSA